jgi:uncharacterized protein
LVFHQTPLISQQLLERAPELNGRNDNKNDNANPVDGSDSGFGHVVSNILGAWTEQVQRFALLVVLATMVLTALAAQYTARNLAMNTSTTDMIDAETPFRRNDAAFKRAFPQFSDVLVVVIDGATPEAAQIVAAELASALAVRSDLFEAVTQPDDDPFFKRYGLLFLDTMELQALADRLAGAAPLLAVLADQPNLSGLFEMLRLSAAHGDAEVNDMSALATRIAEVMDAQRNGAMDTLSWRNLLDDAAPKRSTARRIILTRPRLDYGGLNPAAAAINEIRALAKKQGVTPANGLTLRLTGSVALDQAELESVELGGKTAGFLSLTLVCVLLALGLRSFRLIAASVATLLVGLIWTAAFAAVAIGHLNLISVAFAVLFVGLAVDFSLHYCLRYREALATGLTARAAINETARGCGAALTLSAICAALGFLSFLPTDYKGLAELGLISGCAMFIALFANLTVLPALLALFGKGVGGVAPSAGRSLNVQGRGTRLVLVVALCLGVIAAGVSLQLRFDFNPLNLKDPQSESMAAFLDLADDPRTAPYSIDVLASALDAAITESARLSKLPLVGDVVSLASFVPDGQAEKLGVIEDMAYFLAPALEAEPRPVTNAVTRRAAFDALRAALSGQEASAFIRLRQSMDHFIGKSTDLATLESRLIGYLPMMLADLRMSLSVKAFGLDDIPTHLRRDWVAPSGAMRLQVRPARPLVDNDAIREFAQTVLVAQPQASGAPVTISEAGRVVVGAFLEATMIAMVLIAIVLFVVLRRVDRVLLILGPLTLAAVLTIATSVLFSLPFNFANVIVLPLLLGLGVASGVHLVMRGETAAALQGSSTPRAVLYSALTTLASFGSLMASGHRGMVSMGQLLTISVIYMLIAMLMVLPAQMAWLEKRSH